MDKIDRIMIAIESGRLNTSYVEKFVEYVKKNDDDSYEWLATAVTQTGEYVISRGFCADKVSAIKKVREIVNKAVENQFNKYWIPKDGIDAGWRNIEHNNIGF